MHPRHLNIGQFDYTLPDHRIAQFPLEKRDHSRLLIYERGTVTEDRFYNIAGHLPPDSLVIFNETRVIHARLNFHKESGSRIEVFCLEPQAPHRDHQQAFLQHEWSEWTCLVGNSKRWKSGPVEMVIDHTPEPIILTAERVQKYPDGTSNILFRWDPPGLSFAEVLEQAGKIPLPPYISRQPVASDHVTYQTIYARHEGSVAAPTAGLHFSDAVMSELAARNISQLRFILHVGAGTFRPVSTPDLSGHEMHAEHVYFQLEQLEQLRKSLDNTLILVGTTSVRMMESLYWHGVKLIRGLAKEPELRVDQWDPYDITDAGGISREESLDAVIRNCRDLKTNVLKGTTSLMIAPGYRFRYPDYLITNFHQPKSTLLLLIAAFIGEDWKKAYRYALDHDFRFLSYGDSCLFRNSYK